MALVLVVDDEPDIFELMKMQFERVGFECQWAGSAEQAHKLVQSERYDAIVSDINMPGLNGVDLFHALKRDNRLVSPFIFMTGFNKADYTFLLEMGVDQIFDKPGNLPALVDYVQQFLANRVI